VFRSEAPPEGDKRHRRSVPRTGGTAAAVLERAAAEVAVATPVAAPTVGVAVPVPTPKPRPNRRSPHSPNRPDDGSVESAEIRASSSLRRRRRAAEVGEYVYVEELPRPLRRPRRSIPTSPARRASTVPCSSRRWSARTARSRRPSAEVDPMLDAAAITAVKQWVFKPALSNNKPVAVWVAVPVKFTLH